MSTTFLRRQAVIACSITLSAIALIACGPESDDEVIVETIVTTVAAETAANGTEEPQTVTAEREKTAADGTEKSWRVAAKPGETAEEYAKNFKKLSQTETTAIVQSVPLDYRNTVNVAIFSALDDPQSFAEFSETFRNHPNAEGSTTESIDYAINIVKDEVDFGYNAIKLADRYATARSDTSYPKNEKHFLQELNDARFTDDETAAAVTYLGLLFESADIDWQDYADRYAKASWASHSNTEAELRTDMASKGYTADQIDKAIASL